MKIMSISAFLATAVFIFIAMPVFDMNGFTKAELTYVSIAFLCNLIAALLFLRCLKMEIKGIEKQIKRNEQKVAANEAEQRRLLREIIGPRSMQPNIKKRLPRRQ
jgi:hypothetical protein